MGHDKQWVWYRKEKPNPSANPQTEKVPKELMIFAVIGERSKSKLLFIERTINAAKYKQNIEGLGFIDELDQIRLSTGNPADPAGPVQQLCHSESTFDSRFA